MLIMALIAAWCFVVVLVLAMCKAAARADAGARPLHLVLSDRRAPGEPARSRDHVVRRV
jgi:hypothetical protein